MEPQRDDRTINRFVGEGDGLRRKISWRVFEMAEQGKESLIDLVAFARLVVDEPGSTLKRTLQAVRRHLGMQVAYRRRLDDSAAL
jgi:hypothetical protein